MKSLHTAATFGVGLLAGMMVEEYFFFSTIVADAPADVWVRLHSNFRLLHPYTVIPLAVAVVGVLGVIAWRERKAAPPRRGLALATALTGVGIGVLTLGVMMPLNELIFGWLSSGAPADWGAARDRWQLLQGVRAGLTTAGFALHLLGGYLRP